MQVALLPTFHAHLSSLEEPTCCCLSPFVGVLVEMLVQGEKLTAEILKVCLACSMNAATLESCLILHGCCIPNRCWNGREITGCLTVFGFAPYSSTSGFSSSLWGTDFLCWNHPPGKLYNPFTLT